ncbi:MAG: hypothetical protein AAFX01_08295 [Cyanobacteria bacterium J06638_28]
MTQTSTVNDVFGQARQGSVAAIIQVLNEHLVDAGIRTRAVLANGILQLLCEAKTAEQLSQSELVDRIQSLLEHISPRNIRKVNINSRLVREEQLLWLEEITRDPQGQLLWSELITLKQPNPLMRIWQDLHQPKKPPKISTSQPSRKKSSRQYFWRGLIGGASLCIFLLLVGWAIKHRLGISLSRSQPVSNTVPDVTPPPTSAAVDTYAQAVRLAQTAATDGQTARSPAEWLELAARWQRASDLMAEVTPDHPGYLIAQDRVETYRQNSEQSLSRAAQLQELESPESPPEEIDAVEN